MDFLMSAPQQSPFVGSGGLLFNFYVDSVAGNDSNPGTLALPYATLTKAMASATAFGDGVRIGLKCGSYWRDALVTSSLQNVTIGSYGTGAPPVIDAGQLLTGWTKTAGFTNLYQATASVAIPAGFNTTAPSQYVVWENNGPNAANVTELAAQASQAAADAAVSSCFIDTSGGPGTFPIFYIHATTGIPTTNGFTYETGARYGGIDLIGEDGARASSNNSTVFGVRTRLSLANNGSLVIGLNANVSRVIAERGHKHNLLIGTGSLTDAFIYDSHRDFAGAIPLICFQSAGPIGPITYRRVFVIGHPMPDQTTGENGIGTFTHPVGGGGLTTWTLEQCVISNYFTAGTLDAVSSANGLYLLKSTALHTDGGGFTPSFRYVQEQGPVSGNDRWGDGSLQDHVSYNGSPVTNAATAGQTFTHSFATLVFANGTPYAANQRSNYAANHIIFGAAAPALNVDNTYVGDYNTFAGVTDGQGFHQVYNTLSGTLIKDLASWQAASGQDAHSVWLSNAQQAALFSGTVANGDFRINPAATVTWANGTVANTFPDGTPITAAGCQNHWDWNLRAPVAGPPTAWPNIPLTVEQANTYITNPNAWTF